MMTAMLMALGFQAVSSALPTDEEIQEAQRWITRELGDKGDAVTSPFFSFLYDDKSFADLVSSWTVNQTKRALTNGSTEYTLEYLDPHTGLLVRCVLVAYRDYPTIEWTLYFENTGDHETPILRDIRSVDAPFTYETSEAIILYHNKGDNCTADSYQPLEDPLLPNTELNIANTGGRPTQTAFPYFNVSWGDRGIIFVVSWAGQWSAKFKRGDKNDLRILAGQELTHFKLYPGERVRAPLIVIQFWKGSRVHAQNVFRAWMLEHNLPRPGGSLPLVPQLAACSSHQFGEMIHANRDNQIFFIDKYLERGIKLDYWWMDAGWYYNKTGWPHTGTWEVDLDRFPGGLRAISDHAHARGVKTIVWFEPERVAPETWLAENHPEWILGGKSGGLLNLGNPEAWTWLVNHVDRLITDQGIDLYRQDFNIDPLPYWRANDTEDRQGITEIKHVEGYFAYWDELLRRHPGLLIDSCASGGRRNDLETLRRAVPLLRSDYIMEPVGNQCHSFALASWLPYYGTGTSKTDTYLIRSVLCPAFNACWDQRDDTLDWDAMKRVLEQWKQWASNYLGDYYPLTSYSLKESDWIAWQFDLPQKGTGFVQVFRRANSPYVMAQLPLYALEPESHYSVVHVDEPDKPSSFLGKELVEKGLPISLTEKPSAAVFCYQKQD